MDIAFSHLCDHALIDSQGKLSVIGIFDVIGAGQFPISHVGSFLAFGISLNAAELNHPLQVRIQLVAEDDEQIMEAAALLEPTGQAKVGDIPSVPQAFPIPPIPLAKPGRYSFRLWLNDVFKKDHAFEVKLTETSPQQAS